MKVQHIIAIVLILVGVMVFSRGDYELKPSSSVGKFTFVNNHHRYSMEMPEAYIQPDEECPLRTRNIDTLTYFSVPKSRREDRSILVIGEVNDRHMIKMIEDIKNVQDGTVSKSEFLKNTRERDEKEKLHDAYNLIVYESSDARGDSINGLVFFVVDNKLLSFMFTTPKSRYSELKEMLRSIRRI